MFGKVKKLEKRIEKLELLVKTLNERSRFVVYEKYPSTHFDWMGSFNYYKKSFVTVDDAIRRIMQHLGLSFEYKSGRKEINAGVAMVKDVNGVKEEV
jgi:hypothetical protein